MEKFKIHPCWPKPKVGRIRTVRECDFVGGVGPTPVYPVTSTKAVFNEKNENLEDILKNGTKFQESLWVKNLYTTKIAPYIADGDTAEGNSYIEFNSNSNLDISLKNKTEITIFKDNKEGIYTKLTPEGIFVYNEDDSTVITAVTATESIFNSIVILPLEDTSHDRWYFRIAGISDKGEIGEAYLNKGHFSFTESGLSINWNSIPWESLPIGEGLNFTNGKLNCTVKGNGETSSCNCEITDVQYDEGIKLFTFNGTTVYAPTVDMAVESVDLYSKEQIAKVNGTSIYGYNCFDALIPRNSEVYDEGDFGYMGLPYRHNRIYLYGYGITHDTTTVGSLPVVFTQNQYVKGNPDFTKACPFCYIGPDRLEIRSKCSDIVDKENLKSQNETFPDTFLNITPTSFKYNNEELCIPEYNTGIKIATIVGKAIFVPESSSSSLTIDSPTDYAKTYYLCSTEGSNLYENTGIAVDPQSDSITASAFYQTSDERLKENIKEVEVPLEVLLRIPTVNFNFKDKDKLEMGTIAQEIEKICPEIVNTDGYGYKSVDYSKLSILALKGLKDLTKRVNELEKLIDKIIGE